MVYKKGQTYWGLPRPALSRKGRKEVLLSHPQQIGCTV